MLHATWDILIDLAPWLLLGALVAGVLHVVLPPGWLERTLTGRGGVLKAVLLGVPMPLCSCAVIPTGLGLKRDGASDGAAVGFMISTPQTGVDSAFVSAAFLGWPFALFKVAAAAVTGLVGGWLVEATSPPPASAGSTRDHAAAGPRNLRALLAHAVDLVRSIWGWLVVGILVSAALTTWLPTELLADLGGKSPLVAGLAALVISLPLYVCATASVPIAAALVAGGLPAGAALVFLMAGPATNLATLGAVHRGFGGRALSIYLVTLVVGSLGLGLAFDTVLSITAQPDAVCGAVSDSVLGMASAGLLVGMLGVFAVEDLRRLSRRRAGVVDGLVVTVEGMTCASCTDRLTQALLAEPGVHGATVSLTPPQARVAGHVDESRVRAIVAEAGFTAP